MITLHATKKLYAKLPLTPEGLIQGETSEAHSTNNIRPNPLSGWHGNLITLERRNCILLIHDETRFPIFIKQLVKADFSRFNWHFQDTLMNTLLKLDASQSQIEAAASLLAPCQLDTQCNRSVQGSLNRMKGDIEHLLRHDNIRLEDISPYKASVWLAERPSSIKGTKDCLWPIEAMLKLLTNA